MVRLSRAVAGEGLRVSRRSARMRVSSSTRICHKPRLWVRHDQAFSRMWDGLN